MIRDVVSDSTADKGFSTRSELSVSAADAVVSDCIAPGELSVIVTIESMTAAESTVDTGSENVRLLHKKNCISTKKNVWRLHFSTVEIPLPVDNV